MGPHRTAMRQAIAAILQIDVGRVGVKATTTEGLGFVGRREGIAALASATIAAPDLIRCKIEQLRVVDPCDRIAASSHRGCMTTSECGGQR